MKFAESIILGIIGVMLLIFLYGCASQKAFYERDQQELLQWPSAPEPPRIRYIDSFSNAADLGIKGGFFSRIIGSKTDYYLRRPVAVAANGSGRIYVADLAGYLYYFDPLMKKTRKQENTPDKLLQSPVAFTIGAGDSLYVVDSVLGEVLVYTKELEPVRILSSDLVRPAGIAWDAKTETFYISDAGANCIVVIDLAGRSMRTLDLSADSVAGLNTPTHLWLDDTSLYATDTFNFQVKKISTDGALIDRFGSLGSVTGSFSRPKGVATDSQGHVYVVDALFGNVQIFDQQAQLLLFFGKSGQMEPASFCLPNGIFIDDMNRIYVADTYHGRIQVFQYLDVPGSSQ